MTYVVVKRTKVLNRSEGRIRTYNHLLAPALGFEPSSVSINSRVRSPRVLDRKDDPLRVLRRMDDVVAVRAEKDTLVQLGLDLTPSHRVAAADTKFLL